MMLGLPARNSRTGQIETLFGRFDQHLNAKGY